MSKFEDSPAMWQTWLQSPSTIHSCQEHQQGGLLVRVTGFFESSSGFSCLSPWVVQGVHITKHRSRTSSTNQYQRQWRRWNFGDSRLSHPPSTTYIFYALAGLRRQQKDMEVCVKQEERLSLVSSKTKNRLISMHLNRKRHQLWAFSLGASVDAKTLN